MWPEYVNNSTLNYKKAFHKSIRCRDSRVFYGKIYTMPWIWRCAFVQKNHPNWTHKLLKMILIANKIDCKQNWLQTQLIGSSFSNRNDSPIFPQKKTCNSMSSTKCSTKKTNGSKLWEQHHPHVLQPKADYYGSKVCPHRIRVRWSLHRWK